MNVRYSTKTYRLQRNSFVWIILLFLFLISCNNTKLEVDTEFEQYLITNLDKADKENKISLLQNEYSKHHKIMLINGKLISTLIKLLDALEEQKRIGKAWGIDSSPVDEKIKFTEKKLEETKVEWQEEKRKINAIVKVAKMYEISLQP